MNRAAYRGQLVNDIKAAGADAYAQRVLDEVRAQLRRHKEDLLEKITQQRENGVQDFDSETISRMRVAELARAKCAYGFTVRNAGVHKKA